MTHRKKIAFLLAASLKQGPFNLQAALYGVPSMKQSNRSYLTINNDQGSILIYTLIVLIVLTLVGAIGIQTTWFEIKLAGNDRFINRLKIKAESTALAAVELVEKQKPQTLKDSDWESPTRMPWLSRGLDCKFDTVSGEDKRGALNTYIRDISHWVDGQDAPTNCAPLVPEPENAGSDSFLKEFKQCRFQVIDVEVAHGSSLQTGNNYSTMHNLYITGLSEENPGKCLVQIGYRKRY